MNNLPKDEIGAEALAMLMFLAGMAVGAFGVAIGMWLAS